MVLAGGSGAQACAYLTLIERAYHAIVDIQAGVGIVARVCWLGTAWVGGSSASCRSMRVCFVLAQARKCRSNTQVSVQRGPRAPLRPEPRDSAMSVILPTPALGAVFAVVGWHQPEITLHLFYSVLCWLIVDPAHDHTHHAQTLALFTCGPEAIAKVYDERRPPTNKGIQFPPRPTGRPGLSPSISTSSTSRG